MAGPPAPARKLALAGTPVQADRTNILNVKDVQLKVKVILLQVKVVLYQIQRCRNSKLDIFDFYI